jgi:nitrate reductase NapE component
MLYFYLTHSVEIIFVFLIIMLCLFPSFLVAKNGIMGVFGNC